MKNSTKMKFFKVILKTISCRNHNEICKLGKSLNELNKKLKNFNHINLKIPVAKFIKFSQPSALFLIHLTWL